MSYVEPLMRQNFLEYASYVIVDRAIPDLRDGLKPVQRRILQTLHEMDDGRFHKVANVIGETMKLHPHGDASIGDALVVLANKEYFIEKQGNFGNVLTGHAAAAARYIECRLTPLARETLFHDALTEFQPSYDGRKKEPVFLPAKLPMALLLGSEGIAVGMATKILPHNFGESLRALIAALQKKAFTLHPDFRQGGILDVSEYEDGRGKVRVRARLDIPKEGKQIVIREVPYSKTTESLVASIEQAIDKGKVKISSIEDRTGEEVEIVLHLARGVYADEVEPQLYAYTDCEVSISPNLVVIKERRPREMTVSEVVVELAAQLKARLKAELEYELGQLEARRHWLTLEQIFLENRVWKRLEEVDTEDGLRDEVYAGMKPFRKKFLRPMTDEDVKRLLEIRIRRISAYDLERYRKEIAEITAAIKTIQARLKNMKKTTLGYLGELLDKYEDDHPRRTEIGAFETVDKRAVARQSLKVSYDRGTGFFGHQVRGKDHQLSATRVRQDPPRGERRELPDRSAPGQAPDPPGSSCTPSCSTTRRARCSPFSTGTRRRTRSRRRSTSRATSGTRSTSSSRTARARWTRSSWASPTTGSGWTSSPPSTSGSRPPSSTSRSSSSAGWGPGGRGWRPSPWPG